jgi:hypothetical protein
MYVEIHLFEVGRTPLDFYLWGWMKSEVYKEKVNIRDELFARFMNSAALIKQERQELHALLPIKLKSSLKSIVEFFNTYFEMLQFIEIIYITNNSFVFPSYFCKVFMRNIPHP